MAITISEGPILISVPVALTISGSIYYVGTEELPGGRAFGVTYFPLFEPLACPPTTTTTPPRLSIGCLHGYLIY